MTKIQFNNELLSVSDKLRTYAISLTSDSERARDLLQETLLKVLTHHNSFTQNTNFKAWVYTIMRNTFINDYRRKVKTKIRFVDSNIDFYLSFPAGKNYPAPDSVYRNIEIHRKIDTLDDEYRIPFTLFIEGYKYKEIADKLNLPLGTVKSRIFLSRKKLKKSLQDYSNN